MLASLLVLSVRLGAADMSLHGYAEVQGRWFPESGLYPRQTWNDPSVSARPELRTRLHGVDLVLMPFGRYDGVDRERSHWDLRELNALFDTGPWQWQVGVGQVFWGVTESRHLVDIINQTDLVEDIDGEEKLGQPMIHLARGTHWGRIEGFVLPGFRERTFPGPHGRLYLPLAIDDPVYQSPKRQRHIDFALRWSETLAGWDFGLAWFAGTGRDPRLGPGIENGLLRIYYDQINQYSLDLQGSLGDWVLKLEAFYRDTPVDDFAALVSGFEYTSYGILDGGADLGLLAEYLYDGRENTLETPFQNDLFFGLRLALNDTRDSTALAGVFWDMQTDSAFWRIEASRRLGTAWTLEVELQGFPRTEPGETIWYWRRDGYAQLSLRHWF